MANDIYPATPLIAEGAVYDAEGVRLNTKLGSLSSELTDFLKVDSVKTNGNIVLTDKSGNKKEYMAATPSGDPMHYAYVAAGATWNASTGLWKISVLEDITNAEMQSIYNEKPIHSYSQLASFNGSRSRINIPFCNITGESLILTRVLQDSELEYLVLGRKTQQSTNIAVAFYGAKKFKGLKFGDEDAILDLYYSYGASSVQLAFNECVSLETIYIRRVRIGIDFKDSPLLSAASILYMINNAANTSAITITLHATAYARAIADADIVAAAQAHNITLASA